MTLNGVMALILRYFTEFVYIVVWKQLLGLPRFQNLLLIVYDHLNIRSAQLFNDYFGKTNCDNSVWLAEVHRWLAARTFENQLLAHSLKLVLERTNYEVGSMGVGAGLYMYVVVVKSSRSLSHLLMSSCIVWMWRQAWNSASSSRTFTWRCCTQKRHGRTPELLASFLTPQQINLSNWSRLGLDWSRLDKKRAWEDSQSAATWWFRITIRTLSVACLHLH